MEVQQPSGSSDPAVRAVRTARLVLTAVGADDVHELYPLNADPRVWTHLPSARHTDRAETVDQVSEFARAWEVVGLGYWAARLAADQTFVGIGGCSLRHDAVWNIYYRLRPELQGQGLAREIVDAGLAAVRARDPDRPVVAFLLEHNTASRRLAERAGLELAWRGHDAGNPDPAAIRLVFADRRLDDAQLAAVTR